MDRKERIELLEKNKKFIMVRLFSWSETFVMDYCSWSDAYDEYTDEEGIFHDPFEFVSALFIRLYLGKCNGKDYDNIFFHIDEQINFDKDFIEISDVFKLTEHTEELFGEIFETTQYYGQVLDYVEKPLSEG